MEFGAFGSRFSSAAISGRTFSAVMHLRPAAQRQARKIQDEPDSASSSALHEGAQIVCDFPRNCRVRIWERTRCLPHRKQDMVAPLNDADALNGEPEALAL